MVGYIHTYVYKICAYKICAYICTKHVHTYVQNMYIHVHKSVVFCTKSTTLLHSWRVSKKTGTRQLPIVPLPT
jgi:hypothetical protein